MLLLAIAPTAAGASVIRTGPATWSAVTPVDGAVTTNLRQPVSIEVYDANGILSSPWYKMKVDGVIVTPTFAYTVAGSNTRARISFTRTTNFTAGAHTVWVQVLNGASTYSTYQWNFTASAAPQLSQPAPAAGSTVANTSPVISAKLVAGVISPVTARAWINGEEVAAAYNASTKVVTATLPSALPNDRSCDVTMTVSNGLGLTAALPWSFDVQIYSQMTPIACSTCHAVYASAHPTSDCAPCHGQNSPIGGEYWNPWDSVHVGSGCADCHPTAVTDCARCHTGAYPAIPYHTELAETAHTEESACAPCHVRSLTIEHSRRGATCETCHVSADPAVADAIASGTTACTACHTADHSSADHVADIGANVLGTTTFTCQDCHAMDVRDEHEKGTSSSVGRTCYACHEMPRGSFETWNQTCSQGGCHAAGSSTEMHANLSTAHAVPVARADCAACHEGDVATMHGAASTVDAPVRSSCMICHGAATLTKDCVTCHADRLEPHGYFPEDHTATATCVGSCHTVTNGGTELKPVHDSASGTSFACSRCHAVIVPSLSSEYPPGWDETCTDCHVVRDLHPAANHTGTDLAYQDASFFGSGCTSSASHTDQLYCHDITNLADLHSRMSGDGCQACHGEGKTPAAECYTCHKPGYATTYNVPGTPSANIVETIYPASDAFITPGLTYTTTPAGQPRYAVVNAPYPPVDTTKFVTITSNAAGGTLYGFARPTIPDNARIVSVLIYAKAKATTLTPYRKMQGWYGIGGQTFLAANQSNNLTAVWTAGAGTMFRTAPSRLDYTRQPLYGEMIYQNPKTSADWTPAEINGTDPDSSLDSFGIDLTGSATANNISLAQIYLKVTYYTVGADVTNPTVGTHTYHGDNVKYLHDPSDAPAGQRFAVNPVHGWYDALYYQDCYDFCHRGNGGAPTFSANQGSWMWYSVGGDPGDAVVATRSLTLRPITVPASSATLTFDTNYRLGTGAAGFVEITTDGGSSWTPLTGTVGGSSLASLTGNAVGWVAASYDLSAYAGQTAQLRFRYVNGSSTAEGWAFDSMAVSGGSGTVFSDNAETLKPDWTNQYWTRSMGAFPFQ